MIRRYFMPAVIVLMMIGLTACNGKSDGTASQTAVNSESVSGRVEAGLRVLTLDPAATGTRDFTIYRGDYVRLETTGDAPIRIVIPSLEVSKTYPVASGEKAYFKVPESGAFAYTANGLSGTIRAIDYVATGYREVSAAEGAKLIGNVAPFVLDVRTPGEYGTGHLANAHLVPVQTLQTEIDKLPVAKDSPVFVYCRSGNRSTVAAKMLLDHGFTSVVNLRGGIKAWAQAGLPVEK